MEDQTANLLNPYYLPGSDLSMLDALVLKWLREVRTAVVPIL